ncbi:MAG: gamma-glutamyltransferase [Longimicrobiales bacterium]
MRILLATLLFGTGCAVAEAPPIQLDPGAALATRVPEAWPYSLRAQPVRSTGGMVVTDAPLATDVGVQVLRDGGNAIDAAVASAFALSVVYPEAGNLGGGGFLVLRTVRGDVATLDFREKAPLAATRDMYLDEAGEPTALSLIGHLASGVPGSVAGLWEAHARYGSRPWAELLAPAIRLAEEGFTVDSAFAESVVDEAERLRRFPASAALFLPGDEPLRAGTTWRNPELAAVLRRVAQAGPSGFYEGETADLIVAEMQRGGGLITHQDLQRYTARWREPIRFVYRSHEVLAMPPPSSGGITLALIANLLEEWDLRGVGWHTTRHLHLQAEAMRRAFADRNHYLGDPDFVTIPRERLLSKSYARERAESISVSRATPSTAVTPGAGPDRESDHTTHLSIVDAAGNAIALSTTINSLYGSAVTVAGAGFLLNNEMDDFTAKPGVPNDYGLIQGEANAIAPEKRMLSAMTPVIVTSPSGQLLMVSGARGGPRIITAVYQVLSNVIDFDMAVSVAVNVPRTHHQHLPDVLYFERDGLLSTQIRPLEQLGHDVRPFNGYIGNAPTILRAGQTWLGFADPRQGGKAGGT